MTHSTLIPSLSPMCFVCSNLAHLEIKTWTASCRAPYAAIKVMKCTLTNYSHTILVEAKLTLRRHLDDYSVALFSQYGAEGPSCMDVQATLI